MSFDDRWLAKTLTQTSTQRCSWQTWLIAMHCSQKTFHFLSVSNDPTSILSNILVTLRKSHETIFVGNFWNITNTCERYFWDVSEMSRKTFLKYVRDILKTSHKTSFLRCFWDVIEASQKIHFFKDVFEMSFLLRCF